MKRLISPLAMFFSCLIAAPSHAADCKKKFDAKAAQNFATCTKRAVQDPANNGLDTERLTLKILHQACARETKAQAKHITAQHRCFVPDKSFNRQDAFEHIKFALMGTIDNMRFDKRE
ncbi:MAG: hypothetical protein V4691_05135 [Pseudomonadota bacterium]